MKPYVNEILGCNFSQALKSSEKLSLICWWAMDALKRCPVPCRSDHTEGFKTSLSMEVTELTTDSVLKLPAYSMRRLGRRVFRGYKQPSAVAFNHLWGRQSAIGTIC